VLLVVLATLPFGRALLGKDALYERDIATYVYGQNESLVGCVAGGSWPLWNPHLGFGHPLLADPGLQILYPPTWLNFVVSVETCFGLYAAGHVLLAGAGVLFLARMLGLPRGGRLVAACLYMVSGPLLSSVVTWQHLAGAAWIPWVLGAEECAMRRRTLGSAAAWGLTIAAQLLSGSADMVVLGTIPAALLLMRRLVGRRRHHGLRYVRALFAALGLAAGLTAALWLPAFELLSRTERTAQPAALRLFYSVHPVLALQSLLPLDFLAVRWPAQHVEAVLGPHGPLFTSMYLGLSALPLVVLGARARPLRTALALALTWGLGLLLALGSHGHLFGALQDLLPPLRIFRFPAKATVLCALSWSLLAGIGFGRLHRRLSRPATARWAGAAATAATAITAAAIAAGLLPTGEAGLQLFHASWASACVAGVTALLGFGPGSRRAILPLMVADLLAGNFHVNPTVPRDLVSRPPVTLRSLGPGRHRVFSFEYEGRSPYLSYRRTLFAPPELAAGPLGRDEATALGRNLSLVGTSQARWGLYGSFGFDAVVTGTREHHQMSLLLRSVEETTGFLRLLQLAGVRYVLAFHAEGLEQLRPVAVVPTPYVRPLVVYAVPDSLPRAYVVSGARVVPEAALPALILDSRFDPRKEVVLSSGQARAPKTGFSGEVRQLHLGCDSIRAEVDLQADGYFVLLDAYDAAWQGRVDGAPAPVERANIAFRAVPVPAGSHTVELAYRPRSAVVGLATTALTLLLLAAAGVAVAVRARSHRAVTASADGPRAIS
jgi:hypothetical protein